MKILLSPAKSMDAQRELPNVEGTPLLFPEETVRINKLLKKKSVRHLSKLMHLSEVLAALNYERNQNFSFPFDSENARPAVFYFDGDVYHGLDVATLEPKHYPLLQQNVRILSGLYGLLRPMDLIQAYRLEMGTSMGVGVKKNLPTFWKPKVTTHLLNETQEEECIINLASAEYFAAVDVKALPRTIIHPQFKDYKNGNLKTISFFAKRARGMMARYLVESKAEAADAVLGFAMDGYAFSESHTNDPSKPVFIR